jgi:hypothetical protein
MELSTASQWAEVIGLITILGAAVYSWIQLRELKQARKSAATLSLAKLFQSQDWSPGLMLIFNQPQELESMQEMKEYHGENWNLAITIFTTWESIGAQIYRGYLDFQIVYDLFSGPIVSCYKRTSHLIEHCRIESGIEGDFEWFQWLAERIIEYDEGKNRLPAHKAYTDWKPPASLD